MGVSAERQQRNQEREEQTARFQTEALYHTEPGAAAYLNLSGARATASTSSKACQQAWNRLREHLVKSSISPQTLDAAARIYRGVLASALGGRGAGLRPRPADYRRLPPMPPAKTRRR